MQAGEDSRWEEEEEQGNNHAAALVDCRRLGLAAVARVVAGEEQNGRSGTRTGAICNNSATDRGRR